MSETKNAAAEKRAAEKRQKQQEVLHTVSQTNGQPLHYCADGQWRTDNDLRNLGEE